MRFGDERRAIYPGVGQWGMPAISYTRTRDAGGTVLEARLHALAQVVARLCRKLRLPMPALTYDQCQEINAGVTGTGPHDAVLYFSAGALLKLTPREAAAVAAHELAHIAARDFDDGAGGLALHRHRSSPLRRAVDWLHMVRWTVAKRRREYAADRLAARLIGATPLISALRKTARDVPRSTRPWLATHPHPRRRIRALEKLHHGRADRPRRVPAARNQRPSRTF